MASILSRPQCVNSLRPRPNRRRFADDRFKRIFLNENDRISIKISLKFVPKVRINNIPALVHIMAWRRPGDKPLSEPMMVSLLTHICVTRPQWVKTSGWKFSRNGAYKMTGHAFVVGKEVVHGNLKFDNGIMIKWKTYSFYVNLAITINNCTPGF